MVEVVVSIVLLGIAVMSIAAGATFSTRMIKASEDREAATRIAVSVADSMTFAGEAGADVRTVGRFVVAWSLDDAGMISVSVAGLTGDTLVAFRAVRMPALESGDCGRSCE